MIVLPTSFRTEGEKPHQSSPWIWLVRFTAKQDNVTAPVLFCFTSYRQSITWPVGDASVQTYYPFPFQFSGMEEGTEGDLPQMDLAFDNSTRVMMDLAHTANGFDGAPVTLFLLNDSTKGIAAPNHQFLRWDYTVATCAANDKVLTLRLEPPNYFSQRVPEERYVANRCRWRHGGPECGYIVNAVAAYTSCDKTMTQCLAHGDDEVARNLPRLHPQRFGGFPGIPTERQL